MRKRKPLNNGKLTGTAHEMSNVARRFTRAGGTVHITGHNHLRWVDDEGNHLLTGKTMHSSRLRHVSARIETMIRAMEQRQNEQANDENDELIEVEIVEVTVDGEEMSKDVSTRRLAFLDWLEQRMHSKESVPVAELTKVAQDAGHGLAAIKVVTGRVGHKAPIGNPTPNAGAGPWHFTFDGNRAEKYRKELLVELDLHNFEEPEPTKQVGLVKQSALMQPILEFLDSRSSANASEMRVELAKRLNLPGSPQDYAAWSHDKSLGSKLGFTLTDLKNAGAAFPANGGWQITAVGKKLLEQPDALKRSVLLNMAKARTQSEPLPQLQELEQVEEVLQKPAPARDVQNFRKTPLGEQLLTEELQRVLADELVDTPEETEHRCNAVEKLEAVAKLLGMFTEAEVGLMRRRNIELQERVEAAMAREQEARAALDMLRQVFGPGDGKS